MAAVTASCRRPSGLHVSCSLCCFWMLLLSIHVPRAGSLSFDLRFSKPQSPNVSQLINCTGDALLTQDTLELTRNRLDQSSTGSVGRAKYMQAVRLWDGATGETASFTTTFSFRIIPDARTYPGDGMAFFLGHFWLLAVQLTINGTSYNVNATVDLRSYLPEHVAVGFSAATGIGGELHQILSWSFTSTLQEPPAPAPAPAPPRPPPLTSDNIQHPNKRSVGTLTIAVLVPLLFLLACAGVLAFFWVWGLYGRNAILDAVDERLRAGDELHDECMERVLVVGLWCAHPDQSERPSVAQAMHVLQSEDARLPALPPQMYKAASDLAVTGRSYGALSVESFSGGDSSTTTTTTTTTGDSKLSSGSSTTALLRDTKERS
ncbi:unnamed protein product [Miscanthus lutarioriparius]|uniref:Legume lectin domain-containing protein n=1 Tax=Miscanthus lutarioriparius TaxID=422564 RepID=A0A811RG41_9POAL|nr:unnamed protein product [Miscanthus lutarioriparius]